MDPIPHDVKDHVFSFALHIYTVCSENRLVCFCSGCVLACHALAYSYITDVCSRKKLRAVNAVHTQIEAELTILSHLKLHKLYAIAYLPGHSVIDSL
jgi:hypothetical protein